MEVRRASIAEWNNFVDRCPDSTFFHTPAWYKIWNDYAGYKMAAYLFSFDSGVQVLLPLARIKKFKGIITDYKSSPADTFGGFLVKGPLSDSQMLSIRNWIKSFSNVTIVQTPYESDTTIKKYLKSSIEDFFTQSVDLRNYKLLTDWSSNHKRSFKKAKGNKLKIKIAESSEEWDEYYDVYRDSLSRWGKTIKQGYGKDLFSLLCQLKDQQCKLWLAKYNDKVVSGALCFYHNNHVAYWHGASLDRYFSLRPVHLLFYSCIQDAQNRSYLWFDFNPSGGYTGVEKFKKDFGAIKRPVLFVQKQNRIHRILNRIFLR